MVTTPTHEQPIRVVYTGTSMPVHGRATRRTGGQLYFQPDGWRDCGFMVEPHELDYEYVASETIMPAREVEHEVSRAEAEYLRMFGRTDERAGQIAA